jgi:UDP-N-acetylglucosamine 2-epimerase (non-hydrolysing)
MCVTGTRPEAIKMAPLINEIKNNSSLSCKVLATGQHTDMLYQAFSHFGIIPDFDLKIMKRGQSLDYITSSVLESVGNILDSEQPDMVLVHGDTTTTFASALSSFYRKIPVGHVEAGLRSNDLYMPFPEEMNRVLTDSIATLFFAPTERARENLLSEGKDNDHIFVTGNTVIDALFWTLGRLEENIPDSIKNVPEGKKLVLATAHRRESWGMPLLSICKALRELADTYEDIHILFPVHLNPKVREMIYQVLSGHERITLCEPLGYPDFVKIMQLSYMILSDSGGVQEESTALKRPLLILRNSSERPEATMDGTGVIVGTDTEVILRESNRLLQDHSYYRQVTEKSVNPFGNGYASRIIVDIVQTFLNDE